MRQKKTIAQNLIIYTLKTFIMSVSPFLIFPHVSRVLGTEGVGEVQYAYSIASYFQLLAGLGISTYGIREGALYKDDKEKLGRFSSDLLTVNLLSSSISVILYLLIVFNVEALQPYRNYLYLFAAYVFFAGFTLDWFTSIREDFLYVTIRTTIFQLLVLAVAFVFIRKCEDAFVYAVVLCLPYIFSSITNAIYIKKNVPLFCWKPNIKKHIYPILFLFAIIVSANVYSLLDTTMLGIISGDSAVGLYTAASKYTRLVVQLVLSICTVFLPRLILYISTKQKEKFEKLFLKSSEFILWLTIPCCFGMYILSPELIEIFSGKEFMAAVTTMKILSVNILFSTVDGFLGWQILVPLKKEKFLMYATVTGAILDIVLNLLFIPAMGVDGAALATLCSELCVFTICTVSCRKDVPLARLFRSLWKYFCAAIPIIPIRYLIEKMNIMNVYGIVCVEVILAAGIYVIVLCLFKETLTKEVIEKVLKKFNIR